MEGMEGVRGGCGWAGLGLSLATAGVGVGTVELAVVAAVGRAAGTEVTETVVVIVVEIGVLSLLDASPSPSTRLPTAGCVVLALTLPRLPVLLRRSSAPSGLERVQIGRASCRERV